MFDDNAPHGPAPGWVLAGVLTAVLVVVGASFAGIAAIRSIGASAPEPSAAGGAAAAARAKLPVYWVVRRGDSFSTIAARTGLSVDELEAFNPEVAPESIVVGQRLKLRLRVPRPPPKPKGPRFWTVRSGQTLSAIAAKTGHSVIRLQELNPKLKPDRLQPGQRLRLRP